MYSAVSPESYNRTFKPRVTRPHGIQSRVAYCAEESRKWLDANFPICVSANRRRIDAPQEPPVPKPFYQLSAE